jgi:hypothetical protein
MVALVEKTFGRLCQHFLCTHFELFMLEFIVSIDGKVAPPPSIPTIPSMFFCAFGTFEAQIPRWLRWWVLAHTDATNAHFCTFAFLLHGPHRRYRRHLLRSYAPSYSALLEAYKACRRARDLGGYTLSSPFSATPLTNVFVLSTIFYARAVRTSS